MIKRNENEQIIIRTNDYISIENLQISRSMFNTLRELENAYELPCERIPIKLVNESVTFNIIGADRLDATILCLFKASYVIQSQRYVRNDINSFRSLGSSYLDIEEKYNNLIKDTLDLYDRMTEIKEESKHKKRTTVSDYKHGIPIEDARYIFPLAAKTNISMTISGDKFLLLLSMINKEKSFRSGRLYNAFREVFMSLGLSRMFIDRMKYSYDSLYMYAENVYELLDLNSEVLVDIDDNGVSNIARGAITSTSENPLDAELKYDTTEKKEALISRVAGYNHTSILEQYRFTSKMKCTLVTFQQLSRHRIAVTQPIDLSVLALQTNRKEHIIPKSIQNSPFVDEYKEICDRYVKLMKECIERDDKYIASLLLQNGDVIPFNYTVNVRTDIEVMNKRLCVNAQWEIRELMKKRKKIMLQTGLYSIYNEFARPDCGLERGCQEGAYSCEASVREKAKRKKEEKNEK